MCVGGDRSDPFFFGFWDRWDSHRRRDLYAVLQKWAGEAGELIWPARLFIMRTCI
jgi:hypothetical protein